MKHCKRNEPCYYCFTFLGSEHVCDKGCFNCQGTGKGCVGGEPVMSLSCKPQQPFNINTAEVHMRKNIKAKMVCPACKKPVKEADNERR